MGSLPKRHRLYIFLTFAPQSYKKSHTYEQMWEIIKKNYEIRLSPVIFKRNV